LHETPEDEEAAESAHDPSAGPHPDTPDKKEPGAGAAPDDPHRR